MSQSCRKSWKISENRASGAVPSSWLCRGCAIKLVVPEERESSNLLRVCEKYMPNKIFVVWPLEVVEQSDKQCLVIDHQRRTVLATAESPEEKRAFGDKRKGQATVASVVHLRENGVFYGLQLLFTWKEKKWIEET